MIAARVRHRRRCPGCCSWLGCGTGGGVIWTAPVLVISAEEPLGSFPRHGPWLVAEALCRELPAQLDPRPGAAAAPGARYRAGNPCRTWSLLPASSPVALRAEGLANIRDGSGSHANRCETRATTAIERSIFHVLRILRCIA